jgi:hypothetical protein
MYSEALQRGHALSEPCDPPRSARTKPVIVGRKKKYRAIKWLVAWQAVNYRF